MAESTSLFLDCIRILAAFLVFFTHCSLQWYPTSNYLVMSKLGHDAVIFFFVLSGFVIAYSTLGKSRTLRSYFIARLSRLYSVVIPALFLTLILQIVGTALNPGFYSQKVSGHEFLRYILASSFLQEIWTLSASPRTNTPFWSLGYEFWYYALFGVVVLIKSLRLKLTIAGVLLLVIGPKVLLLLPIWAMGVALYMGRCRVTPIKVSQAKLGFVLSLAITILIITYMPDWPMQHGYPPLFLSSSFISDWIKGFTITATIYFFDQAFCVISIPAKFLNNVRTVADHTFSLYLYHYPLIVFVNAIVTFDRSSPYQAGLVTIVILSIVFLISTVTESKRSLWNNAFSYSWNRLICK
jgi:peptidoglycan/LPS O-acetylase OafA/YrhL